MWKTVQLHVPTAAHTPPRLRGSVHLKPPPWLSGPCTHSTLHPPAAEQALQPRLHLCSPAARWPTPHLGAGSLLCVLHWNGPRWRACAPQHDRTGQDYSAYTALHSSCIGAATCSWIWGVNMELLTFLRLCSWRVTTCKMGKCGVVGEYVYIYISSSEKVMNLISLVYFWSLSPGKHTYLPWKTPYIQLLSK